MAINSSHYDENKQVQLHHGASSKGSGKAPSCLTMQSTMSSGTSSNASNKRQKPKNNGKTAYVTSDRVQLLSRLTEQKYYKGYTSSFELAANIYKSNSDEFKIKKKLGKKSNKKSVLTLPNEPSILPQACTVSDMNDAEYIKRIEKPKAPKKKKPLPLRKFKIPTNAEYEFYDKEADYCSQMNVYLDCSSTDMVKNFKGDCRKRNGSRCNATNKTTTSDDDSVAPNDVWAVLRNINRFQFNPSPPISDDSSIVSPLSPRKKKVVKKKLKRGVYETCCTEQIAYISSIEVKKSPKDDSATGSSSIVTVIDNKNSEQVQKTTEKNVPRIKPTNKRENPVKAKINIKKTPSNNRKAICYNNRSTECKSINSSDVAQTETKKPDDNNSSNVTLTNQKSETSLESEVTSKRVPSSSLGEMSCGGDICTEVRIQSDLSKKGSTTQSRIDSKVGINCANVGPIGDANHQNANIYGRHDARVPLRRPLPSRLIGQDSTTQARPGLQTTRPLMSGPTKIVQVPRKSFWTLSRLEESPRTSPHSITTVSGAEPTHQYTPSDIRRRLARIKFPLVILGRDELSGNFKVENCDNPQFNGLDKHVWPFMLDWTDKTREPFEPDTNDCGSVYKSTNNQRSSYTLNKQKIKDNKTVLRDTDSLKNGKKEPLASKNSECKNGFTKLKPILQFRDKMLRLLYKKTSDQKIAAKNLGFCVQGGEKSDKVGQLQRNYTNLGNYNTASVATSDVSIATPKVVSKDAVLRNRNIVDVATRDVSTAPHKVTSPSHRPVQTSRPRLPPTSPSKILLSARPCEKTRTWSKAKWTSDMIDKIIQKIQNGTYYTNDFPSSSSMINSSDTTSSTSNLRVNDSKEIQVTMPVITGDFTPKITIQKKKDPVVLLPGFDDALPPLEIKSMTRNLIAVRHCVTNVLLQFDVNLPLEMDETVNNFKRSPPCIPLSTTDSKTKVFKCKTRLLNAMLPAEICSIIPRVMKQFMDRDDLSLTLPEHNNISPITTSTKNHLSPISEHTVSEMSLLPQISMRLHPELRRLRDGMFSKNPKSWTRKSELDEMIYIVAANNSPYEYHSLEGGLLHRPIVNPLDYLEVQLDCHVISKSVELNSCITSIPLILPQATPSNVNNLCRDLVPYSRNAMNVMAYGGCSNLQNVLQMVTQFWKALQIGTTNAVAQNCSLFTSIQLQTSNIHVSVNISLSDDQGLHSCVCINVTNLRPGQLNQATTESSLNSIANSKYSEKRIEYIKHAEKKGFKKTPSDKSLPNVISKCKRMGHATYVRLYKKCKSTSHIAAERSSTPLSKVTNLDEFFQALGAGKLLSSAVDGSCGKKILSCISELRKWITGLTPRQALLVMLLTNKKETSNLVRFRPVILQGIAVNRITRVDELDMEVEVIERECFNKLAPYPGLPSVLESTQNNDNLFEELCWIAKTTASDYQRSFDESSEKLLKALLEKRKKLNPSYLRVMARYVGLGLLKTPARH